jgi:uncharacterized membrane protein YdbT with pleckstrin-like domain
MSYVEKLLSEDEKILARQRQHWAVFVGFLIGLSVQAVFLIAMVQILDMSKPPEGIAVLIEKYYPLRNTIDPFIKMLPSWVLPGLLILFLAQVAIVFLNTLATWLTTQDIVTSRRVVHLSGIFSKTVVDSSLEKINDVLLHQSFLGRILGYGNLSIMTASEVGLNHMRYLKRPIEFKRIMMDAKRSLSAEGGPLPQSSSRVSVADRMAQLEELKKRELIGAAEFEAKRQKLLDEI